jgi:hypothetical protein
MAREGADEMAGAESGTARVLWPGLAACAFAVALSSCCGSGSSKEILIDVVDKDTCEVDGEEVLVRKLASHLDTKYSRYGSFSLKKKAVVSLPWGYSDEDLREMEKLVRSRLDRKQIDSEFIQPKNPYLQFLFGFLKFALFVGAVAGAVVGYGRWKKKRAARAA